MKQAGWLIQTLQEALATTIATVFLTRRLELFKVRLDAFSQRKRPIHRSTLQLAQWRWLTAGRVHRNHNVSWHGRTKTEG
jgi:hypothetical protein